MIKVGDIVVRKSYDKDLYFEVKIIKEDGEATLSCLNCRLKASSPICDLERVKKNLIRDFKKQFYNEVASMIGDITKRREQDSFRPRLGKVLHIDGDEGYLKMCLEYYEKLGIPVIGKVIPENEQPDKIIEFLRETIPDILVITGHDAIGKNKDQNSLDSYKTSKYFVESVKNARQYQSSKDYLAIFAGACQSFYEKIMDAGANYASSPDRVFIHALDPVFIAERLASTGFEYTLPLSETIENTMSGTKGIGGIQTRGSSRIITS